MRLVIMFDNFGPYHLARLAAARERARQEGITVYGLETVGRSKEYQWVIENNDIREQISTIFSEDAVPRKVGIGAFPRIWIALNRIQADVLAVPGYRDVASITAFMWAKTHGKISVMMSESTYEDRVRNYWGEYLKSLIVRRFDAALVGGQRQKEYAVFLGIPPDRIFLGYDVVDNDYFAQGAEAVRRREKYYREMLGLPHPFFLVVSRFIAKKNLSGLLQAYAGYRSQSGEQAWDLVLCGSGPLEEELKNRVRATPGIHFPGFVQVDRLPFYYGLASAFILPSSHFEQWGLVVNEAMASGLPVLVSRVCGCAPDLVQEGVNGFTFNPHDTEELSGYMVKMTRGEKLDLQAMGEASRRIIAAFTPDTFAENLLNAVKIGLGH